MYRILIVEDEIAFAQSMAKAIQSNIGGTLVHICHNAADALAQMRAEEYHLFLLDIMMPDLNGVELAKCIRKNPTYKMAWIIFLTAITDMHREAIDQAQCYAYLTKPAEIKQIVNIIQKLMQYKVLPYKKQYLTFRLSGMKAKVLLDDILYIETQNKDLQVHTLHESTISAGRVTLVNTLKQLPSDRFRQCHKSFIINMDYLESVHMGERPYLTLRYREDRYAMVPVGNVYKENIRIL